jgi:acetolactate synthase-1/2/3 large subunit
MTGAESLVRTLAAGGVEVCFTNPGTSEIHIVAALEHVAQMRSVLCLFEGVATGAADGYARMAGKPACTLLHLGPGLGNGLANLHNARRAQVPLINVVGQHAVKHLPYDTPLTSDIEGIARPVSAWVRTSACVSAIGRDAADAIIAARTTPGRIATLIVSADAAWSEGGVIPPIPSPPYAPTPSSAAVERAATMLRSGHKTAILLTGHALYGEGLAIAGQVAAATKAKLLAPYPITRLERGIGKPPVERIHYVLEQAIDQLKEFHQLILVGVRPPVAYFAYPNKSSVVARPDCEIHCLAHEEEDILSALELLASALGCSDEWPVQNAKAAERLSVPQGGITLSGVASAVGALLPENAIVVDESMTSGRGLMAATRCAPAHDWLTCTGGSIGIAMPLAVGAAVACPDRPVLCLTADGSGMYTLQALWTMAREGLNVTTLVFANRSYSVLKREYSYLGVGEPGPRAQNLFDIGRPDLDWVSLAKGMGVPATRTASLDGFAKELCAGFVGSGPSLIEVSV